MHTAFEAIPSRREERAAKLWGTRVSHEWEIEGTIGQGGMGVVYAAKHVDTGERVAIKVLADAHLRDPRAARRFAREMRVAMKLESPHVARVRSVGRLPTGEPMMVMELLEGEDLGAFAKRRHSLSPEEAVRVIAQACDAVGEAHESGFIHRDLKLANLFLQNVPGGAPMVKVLDFGLAKATENNEEHSLTEAGTCLGTPHYMAPEMFQCSRDVDARVDVWALGVCLYRLVTGMVPFNGLTMVALCAQVLQGELVPPSALRPDLPKVVEDVILRCLERDRDRRYADARALGRALARALRDLDAADRRVQSFTRLFVATPPPPPPDADMATMVEPRGQVIERTTARWPIAPPPIAAPVRVEKARNAETVTIPRPRKTPWASLIAVAVAATAAGLIAVGLLAQVM